MSKLTLIIGNKNYSSWSLRPWLFLRHHNIEFSEKRVPLFEETTERELAQYDSDFKVPVLKDGDLIVWDSLSILEYLSETCLAGSGWPEKPGARSIARSVSAEMHSSYINLRNELPMNCRRRFDSITLSKDAQREVERVKALWRRCRREFGGEGEWLFGDFSIADAMFAPVAVRFSGYNIELGDIEAAYTQSVLKHPGMIDWIEAGKQETEIIESEEINI
ncbi:MAG: glutathione S-transferase family protein [Candidatus Thiodiazotropha sp.]